MQKQCFVPMNPAIVLMKKKVVPASSVKYLKIMNLEKNIFACLKAVNRLT